MAMCGDVCSILYRHMWCKVWLTVYSVQPGTGLLCSTVCILYDRYTVHIGLDLVWMLALLLLFNLESPAL